jgi:D-glycero-beta-D-manno-heptose 1-phosphate adenylyltransferase
MKVQNNRIILNYSKLKKIINAHKSLGHKIVCTVGSWDMLHIGHLRYLIKAKSQGDILIVGTDSDKGIKLYKKNKLRPVIPQEERMEMLKYQECVDYVTLINDINKKGEWQYGLIKSIRPNIFVATPEAYPKNQIKNIKKYSDKVMIFSRQAEKTSTTDIIERMIKKHLKVMLTNTIKKG